MNQPRFSIVIPTHNGERYIAAAIESVLHQTYPDFEIIVLEHESTDHTVEIVRSYNDSRIRICSTDQPQTIESNWARILDLELVEYLTILGHDDILYPEFLSEISRLIAQEPGASLYITHFHIIDSDGTIIRPCKPMPYKESGEEFMQARQKFQRDSFGTGYVMKSADYKRVGGFPPFARLIFADDFVFYALANMSGKVCSPQYLFGYRYHRKSEAYLSGLETLADASHQLMAALEKTPYAQNPNNLTLTRDYLNMTFIRRYIRIVLNLMRLGNRGKLKDYARIRQTFRRDFPNKPFSIYTILAGVADTLVLLPITSLQKRIAQALYHVVAAVGGIKD